MVTFAEIHAAFAFGVYCSVVQRHKETKHLLQERADGNFCLDSVSLNVCGDDLSLVTPIDE